VALAVQAGGLILVVDPSAGTGKRGALFAVDPETGLRRIVSDFGKASQGPLGTKSDVPNDVGVKAIAIAADGRVLVGDSAGNASCVYPTTCGVIYVVAPDGTRSVFRSYNGPGPGPAVVDAFAIAPDGALIVGLGSGGTPGRYNTAPSSRASHRTVFRRPRCSISSSPTLPSGSCTVSRSSPRGAP